jgi:hypothetical protein
VHTHTDGIEAAAAVADSSTATFVFKTAAGDGERSTRSSKPSKFTAKGSLMEQPRAASSRWVKLKPCQGHVEYLALL